MFVKLTLDDRHDGTLLNGRRALETVSVYATEKLRLQVHGVKGVGGFIVVGFDLACKKVATSVGGTASEVRENS